MSQKPHTAAFLQRGPGAGGTTSAVVVLTGSRIGAVVQVDPSGTVLGRASDVDLVLDDDGISRVHAMILVEDGRWVVRDLGSTNGTFVGERRVGDLPLMLHPGDRIRCGSDVLLRFGTLKELERDFVEPLFRAITRDPLTGLRNAYMLRDYLHIEVAWHRRHDLPLSLLQIDVDLLAVVNETFGRTCGDEVLKGVARILEERTRTEDMVVRYRGDVFVVLLRHTDIESAHDLAESFREAIFTHTFRLQGRKARVSVSIGVATHEGDELLDGESLLGEAGSHVLIAKQQGRNRVVSGLER